ncbi:MAG: hypothetical protein H6704_18760 [Myxococcales bacterium]|nr:hypothetical protein [Myxococcales bacterium]
MRTLALPGLLVAGAAHAQSQGWPHAEPETLSGPRLYVLVGLALLVLTVGAAGFLARHRRLHRENDRRVLADLVAEAKADIARLRQAAAALDAEEARWLTERLARAEAALPDPEATPVTPDALRTALARARGVASELGDLRAGL